MSFEKAKVTIELAEYSFLLEKVAEKSKDIDYNEAYSMLISVIIESCKSPMGHLSNEINRLNMNQNKYLFSFSESPVNKYAWIFKVNLKTNG